MTMVITTYIFLAPEGLNLGKDLSYGLGGLITMAGGVGFIIFLKKTKTQ